MEERIRSDAWTEYRVSAENVTLRLLVIHSPVWQEAPTLPDAGWELPDSRGGTPVHRDRNHTHACTELFVCLKDWRLIRVGEELIRMEAGDLVMVPMNMPHCMIDATNRDSWCSVQIHFRRRQGQSGWDLYRMLSRFCLTGGPRVIHGRSELCRKIEQIVSGRFPDGSGIPALEMLLVLARFCEEGTEEPPTPAVPDSPPLTNEELTRTAQLEQIINTRFSRELRAEDVAHQLFISTRHLSRLTHQRYHSSFHRVIIAKRIEVAEGLLTKSDLTAEQIGQTVGFRTKSCFYRAFREAHGMTPAEYRERMAANGGDAK